MTNLRRIVAVDSHTSGEPTRIIIEGGPDLGRGPLQERKERLSTHHDWLRRAAVLEPRGGEVVVGALLCEPDDPTCAAGVIFFNNVGYLGMCGHGVIGLVVTLAHLSRIEPGKRRIETPVGVVTVELGADGAVAMENVPCYRRAKDAVVDIPQVGPVAGDVAWGGNWFFLVHRHDEQIALANVERLTGLTKRILRGVNDGPFPEVNHVELFGPPLDPTADSKNFVLCPGGQYDRSPCGTGTSAKLACLYADGKLKPGDVWRQEGVVGGVFEGSIRVDGQKVIPTIRGTAFITAETTLILDPRDPLIYGIAT